MKTQRFPINISFWQECGRPELTNEIFKKCMYVGLGASATRALLLDIDSNRADLDYTAEMLGYNDVEFKVVLTERKNNR